MKNTFLLFLCVFTLGLTSMNASFPVNKANAEKALATVTVDDMEATNASQDIVIEEVAADEAITPAVAAGYDKWVAAALWFVLGGFAAHRWYAKKPVGWNILFILTLGGLFVWSIVDIYNILTDNFQ